MLAAGLLGLALGFATGAGVSFLVLPFSCIDHLLNRSTS